MTAAPRSFVSGVAWNTVLMGVSWPLSIAIAVALGRLLGPAGKGEFALANVIATLLLIVFQWGVPASISYHLGGRRVPAAPLVKTILILAAVFSLMAIGFTFLIDQIGWSRYVFGVPRLSATVWVMVLGLPFQFTGTFLQFVVLASGQRVLFAVLPAVGLSASVLLMTVFFARGALSPFTAALSVVVSQILTGLILMGYQQREVRWLQAPALAGPVWRSLVSFSTVSHAGAVLHFLVQRLDVLLVGAFLDLRSVGLYSVAYGVAELLLLLPQRLATLYFPRVAASRAPSENKDEARLAASLVLLATTAAAVGLAGIGPPAIRTLYGAAFAPAAVPLLLLLPGVCGLAVSSILATYLAGMGRVRTVALISAVTLAVTVLLNVLLIPTFGIAGCATASSLTYSLQAILITIAAARLTGVAPHAMFTTASPAVIAGLARRTLLGLRWQFRGGAAQ